MTVTCTLGRRTMLSGFVERSDAMVPTRIRPKFLGRTALVVVVVLLVPLLAMQFTEEVAWDLVDFAIAGALLFGVGLAYELLAGRRGNAAYRVAIGAVITVALVLVWVQLAVHIF